MGVEGGAEGGRLEGAVAPVGEGGAAALVELDPVAGARVGLVRGRVQVQVGAGRHHELRVGGAGAGQLGQDAGIKGSEEEEREC